MSREAMIDAWKDPTTRDPHAEPHPAETIRIDARPALGRRTRLLAWPGEAGAAYTSTFDLDTATLSGTIG